MTTLEDFYAETIGDAERPDLEHGMSESDMSDALSTLMPPEAVYAAIAIARQFEDQHSPELAAILRSETVELARELKDLKGPRGKGYGSIKYGDIGYGNMHLLDAEDLDTSFIGVLARKMEAIGIRLSEEVAAPEDVTALIQCVNAMLDEV